MKPPVPDWLIVLPMHAAAGAVLFEYMNKAFHRAFGSYRTGCPPYNRFSKKQLAWHAVAKAVYDKASVELRGHLEIVRMHVSNMDEQQQLHLRQLSNSQATSSHDVAAGDGIRRSARRRQPSNRYVQGAESASGRSAATVSGITSDCMTEAINSVFDGILIGDGDSGAAAPAPTVATVAATSAAAAAAAAAGPTTAATPTAFAAPGASGDEIDGLLDALIAEGEPVAGIPPLPRRNGNTQRPDRCSADDVDNDGRISWGGWKEKDARCTKCGGQHQAVVQADDATLQGFMSGQGISKKDLLHFAGNFDTRIFVNTT